jgi:hypothetical protein
MEMLATVWASESLVVSMVLNESFFVSSAKVEESGLFCVDSSAVKTSTAAPPESNNKGDAVFVNDVSEIQSPYLNYAIMFQVIEHIANTTNQINHM